MKNSWVPNVRLVRCPKCKEVLPEPADVPYYRCGGCDTILQAKHYKKANIVKGHVHGEESSSSNAPPFMDRNEGLNKSNAQNGNLEQQQKPGVSNSSIEASISSLPEQQLPSFSSQQFPDRDEEAYQDFEATSTMRDVSSINESSPPSHEESSINESSPPSHEEPSKSDPQTDEAEEDSGGFSSDKSMEKILVPQIGLPGGEIRQGVVVAEEQLEAADPSNGVVSPEATLDETDSKVHETNQNASMNRRLDLPGASSFPAEALLSDEPTLHETISLPQVPAEEEHADSTELKEHLQVSDIRSEPRLSNEPTAGEYKLSSQLGSPNEDVMTTQPHLGANSWEGLSESEGECEGKASSTDESVSIIKRDGSSLTKKKRDGSSQSVMENQEGANNVVDICGMNVSASNQSKLLENNELSQLVTVKQELDDEGTVQNELGICNEDQVVDYLNDKIITPAGVKSKGTDQLDFVLPEAEKISGSNLSTKSELSTVPYENGNNEPRYSAEGDAPAYGNKIVPSLPTLMTKVGAGVLNLDDRSQNIVETNPREKIEELQKAAPNSLESKEDVDTHLEASTSYEDLPKSTPKGSFAYDGNDRRHSSMGKVQAISVGGDVSYHSEERNTPVMLNEIRVPEVLSDVPIRRNRRTWTQEYTPRGQLYAGSEERRYDSSDLVHKDFYDHPSYCPPYRYRDVESRVRLHERSDVDGRMVSEAVWMGEEFDHMRPYTEPPSEMYPHPRHQVYYHERREAEYQPLVHSMARVAYSGERLRSGYRVLDSYSYHLYPGDRRWSSHLPPPGVSYSRGRYDHFGSYNASPQESDYYGRSHDTSSEDQRMSRLQLRRRSQGVQHIQPIGGAAPFIRCYECSQLLQLPSDFVLFKGVRIHRVKCSACSRILKFTLEKGRHLVPYVPIRDPQHLHTRSASASTYGQISERVSLRSSSGRQRSKGGEIEEKGRAAKVTWKVEERSTSPLHRLMGYSSPSAVFKSFPDLEIQD